MKVAGTPTHRDGETCLEALAAKGIRALLKDDPHNLGAHEVWVHASQEPQARLVMGLSGRSVIRLKRPRPEDEAKEKIR